MTNEEVKNWCREFQDNIVMQCGKLNDKHLTALAVMTFVINNIEKCEQHEYVLRLNRQYIDRVKHSGLGKGKSIEYIERHLVESTRSLIDWSDNE